MLCIYLSDNLVIKVNGSHLYPFLFGQSLILFQILGFSVIVQTKLYVVPIVSRGKYLEEDMFVLEELCSYTFDIPA